MQPTCECGYMNDVLNEAEVAKLLDCEPATVQENARMGKLPAVKFGRSWRFPRSALMEALHKLALENKPRPKPAPAAVCIGRVRRQPPPLPTLSP